MVDLVDDVVLGSVVALVDEDLFDLFELIVESEQMGIVHHVSFVEGTLSTANVLLDRLVIFCLLRGNRVGCLQRVRNVVDHTTLGVIGEVLQSRGDSTHPNPAPVEHPEDHSLVCHKFLDELDVLVHVRALHQG